MITKLHIAGYKSIKDQTVDLSPINILIGSNGVGKSNFISIFSLIRAIYQQELQSYVLQKGGANNLLYFGKKTSPNIQISLDFKGLEASSISKFEVNLGVTKDDLYIHSVDTHFYNGTTWYPQNHEQNVRESHFRYSKSRQAYYVNPQLQTFEVYHFHDTGDSSPIKSPCLLSDNNHLKKDGSNIAAFLWQLKENHFKNYIRIVKTIQSIAPFFQDFILNPFGNQDSPFIKLAWSEKGVMDSYFDAYSLSDGTLRFICLVTLLLQPNPPATIIIDEPELGLHPVAINKLAGLIHKISDKTQFIISTQSTDFVDNFEPQHILVADRVEKATVFKHLDINQLKDWLNEYSISAIWRKNMIGGQPF